MNIALLGKSAIITGGSKGLGFTIAKSFIAEGANVIICARNDTELKTAQEKLGAEARPGQIITSLRADISNNLDVSNLVAHAVKELPNLEILVNNAAIVGPIGPAEQNDWEAWKQTIEVNLFGGVLLCRALIPHFRRRKGGRIIQLSAGGATAPDPAFSAYAASKAAIVSFSATLAEEVRKDNIYINTIAPGGLSTPMLDEKLAAGPDNLGLKVYEILKDRKQNGGSSIQCAANLAVFLSSDASTGITGKLLSAVWDDWQNITTHIDELQDSDIYTLRRILPKDRSKVWDKN